MAVQTGRDYYVGRTKALMTQHEGMMALGIAINSEIFTKTVLEETRAEFELLIPQIPYIGGAANPMTDILEQMTTLLATYRVLKVHGHSVDTIGTLVHKMAQRWIDRHPQFLRHLIGRIYMTRLMRARVKRNAAISQQKQYEGNFVYEVVEGDKDKGAFEWGVNYLECGVVKYFHAQDADEFTPYMCVIDYLMFPALGIDLQRQGTIANHCTHCDFRYRR
jgi:hypothetical protein